MTTKQKKYTQKEKLEIFEAFFHRLHFHRYLTMNESKILEMLAIADSYVNAHSSFNGERSDQEIQNAINAALEKMSKLP